MKYAVGAAMLVLAACTSGGPPLPVLGHVPPFELTAQNGQPFPRGMLDGKIWVADFIFTTCTGPCPRMSARMRRVQDSTPAGVMLVSFTVDPEHDTPPVLAEYARRYQADARRWFFLTGEPAKLNALARDAFKLSNVDGAMIHSTRFVLVDRQGRIRGYYGSEEDEPVARLVEDVRRLERDKS